MNNFEEITKNPETLGAFLRGLPVIEAPWDEAFQRKYCAGCGKVSCDVAAAVKSFQKWQAEKMGRDVNPSRLIALLMQTGVKRVEVRSPVFTTVADNAVAQIGTVSVVNGGAERE